MRAALRVDPERRSGADRTGGRCLPAGVVAGAGIRFDRRGLDPRGAQDAKAIAAEDWEKVLENAVAKPALFVGRKVRCIVNEGKNKSGGVSLYRNYSPFKEAK